MKMTVSRNNYPDYNEFIYSPSLTKKISVKKHYPYSAHYFENYIKRLNSKNVSIQNYNILDEGRSLDGRALDIAKSINETTFSDLTKSLTEEFPELFNTSYSSTNLTNINELFDNNNDNDIFSALFDENGEDENTYSLPEAFFFTKKTPHARPKNKYNSGKLNNFGNKKKKTKSENFEVISSSPYTFADIGGYTSVKQELLQSIDILVHYKKYKNYNIRVPKGLILEGPPGNGKTLLAKGLAGEANASFISVSGSEFQDKYVGVGASRVRELFELANDNIPCIIFIDEIDAIGRKRSTDSESSSSERDSTLNQLLINMDGFKTTPGIFMIGATNRADLLDPALLRPGRIDKRVFIGLPDAATREAIVNIHINGKPHDSSVNVSDLVDLSMGLSGAQLENLLNEAMLYAIRMDRDYFTQDDIDIVMNRIVAGWQPTEHIFSSNLLEKIAIHEMGHAIVGLLAKQHSRMTKAIINLSSPQSPGYTMFEASNTPLYTREALFEHLMILLAGRIAEEVFYNVSVTTGAINDFEEALKLAEKMVVYYGMGRSLIYPSLSEKYKERIDNEVVQLIQDAYYISNFLVKNCKEVIRECSVILQKEKIIRAERIMEIVTEKYPEILNLYTK
jgi:cell division protease FtsH